MFEGSMFSSGKPLPSLMSLFAGLNRFTSLGDISRVAALQTLDVNHNLFDGQSLPATLWEDIPNLMSFDASYCNLNGSIPVPLTNISLSSLVLSNNQLTVGSKHLLRFRLCLMCRPCYY